MPRVLLEQLNENGILIAPVGPEFSQRMLRIRKKDGKFIEEELGDFIFVPLTH